MALYSPSASSRMIGTVAPACKAGACGGRRISASDCASTRSQEEEQCYQIYASEV
jgi:hypothetical protein